MAQYSPELLAALRQRYEQTDQPMNALAAEFGIGVTTLQTLARKNGWSPRSQRMRHCPPTMRELAEAEPLAIAPEGLDSRQETPTPTLPLSGGGSEVVAGGESEDVSAGASATLAAVASAQAPASSLSKAERLEALVEKEIAAEEATRAVLGIRPRSRNEAERCARTISKLTQALQALQKLRGGDRAGVYQDDEVPEDPDEFRNELARKINGLIEAEIGRERMTLNQRMAGLTDEEVKELIEVGRERGMQALLQPEAEEKE